jgi:Ran GTPase-activating protein (RanGAP) involved in mRNA processing and transport
MDTNDRFAQLRALLYDPPTPERAAALLALFAAWPPERSRHVARSYADEALTRQLGPLLDLPAPSSWSALVQILESFDRGEELTAACEVVERGLEGWPRTFRTAPAQWWRSETDPRLWSLARAAVVARPMLAAGWDTLFADRRLARLEVLDFGGCRMGHGGMQALVSSEQLANLRDLRLRRNALDGSSVALLCQRSTAGLLEALDLSDNRLGQAGALAIAAQGSRLSSLASLAINGAGLGDEGVATLAACSSVDDLRSLEVAENAVGPKGAGRLAEWIAVRKLAHLDVSSNPLEVGGLEQLLAGGVGALRSLSLRRVQLHRSGTRALANAHLGGLSSLDVSDNEIGANLACLLGAGWTRDLTHLNLSENRIADVGALSLTGAALGSLSSLDLSRNGIGPTGVRALVVSGVLRGLERLSLSGNPLGDEGVAALAVTGALDGIRELHIAHAGVGPKGASELAASLGLCGLEVLNLRGNQVGVEGASALADSPYFGALRTLDLQGNRLRDDEVRALAASKRLQRLLRLDLELYRRARNKQLSGD